MALHHKGVWGHHPLRVSLANTSEPLFLVNRPGNRPSHEGAAGYLDQAVALCRRGGFTDILLRGDTDFSQTRNANGACAVMAALAWSLEAWMASWLPVDPRWRHKHEAERRDWLRMDFRSFRNAVLEVPAQILVSGRQRIWRLLGWRPQLPNLFRLLATL